MSRSSRAAAIALAACLLAVAVVVLWPHHLDIVDVVAAEHRALDPLVRDGLPAAFTHYGAIEFAGNVLMFAPLGFLGTLALPRRLWWVAPLACLVLSAGIETTQLLFLPGRTFAPRDIVSNTTGGVLGTAVAVAVRAALSTRGRRHSAAAQ